MTAYAQGVSESREGGSWPKRPDPIPLPREWSEADGRLLKLAARVFDPELSKLLIELQTKAVQTVTAGARDEAFHCLGEFGSLVWRANSRIGALLPDLF